jgi:hypothetical protein
MELGRDIWFEDGHHDQLFGTLDVTTQDVCLGDIPSLQFMLPL